MLIQYANHFRHNHKKYILYVEYDSSLGGMRVTRLWSEAEQVFLPADGTIYRTVHDAEIAARKQIDSSKV